MEGSANIPSPRKPRLPKESSDYVPLLPIARRIERANSCSDNREDTSRLNPGELGDAQNASRTTSPDAYSFLDDEEPKSSMERLIEGRPVCCHFRTCLFKSFNDPNLPDSLRDLDDTSEIDMDELKALEDDSPYEEVRAAVS